MKNLKKKLSKAKKPRIERRLKRLWRHLNHPGACSPEGYEYYVVVRATGGLEPSGDTLKKQ
jgi:hypothetical protein